METKYKNSLKNGLKAQPAIALGNAQGIKCPKPHKPDQGKRLVNGEWRMNFAKIGRIRGRH